MAEGVLFDVAKGIIRQLDNLALKEIRLLWGVNEELEKLTNTVSTIKAVLHDAEEQQEQSHAIKDWVAKLKDVLFEADDLLDDFSTEVLRREVKTRNKKAKEVRIFFSKSNQLAYGFKMGHKIQAIRESLDAIATDRKFHLEERPRETQVTNPIREIADTIIGREHDKKLIINCLLDSNIVENVSVLPIVGIRGSGKTTLAKLVYTDEKIQNHFEKKMWVCISVDFDVRKIIEIILESAKGVNLEKLEMKTLINELQKEIDGKRYLLVLDDVWIDDLEKWESIKKPLLCGAGGSRILVTTREEKVANISKTVQPYFLRGLNEAESWSLFEKIAFEKEPENLRIKEIGMEMIRKCRGIPLAIKTIGSRLYNRNSEEEWLSFMNNEFSELVQNEGDILPTLKLSYDHLPSHLKRCFVYCSLFPKDYKINKQTLIRLWMAQGFISLLGQNKDVGNEYFTELLSRSFFEEVEEDEWGNMSFKIHYLVHDLLASVAGQESIIIGINGGHIDEKTRHVSFDFHLRSSSLNTQLFKSRNLRTFLLCGQELGKHENGLDKQTCKEIVSHYKFLRVLDLHETGIKTIPRLITKLYLLRYLDLSGNKHIKMLPNFLSRLQNLQTLKLSGCVQLKELPRDLSNLVNLRFLEIDGCWGLTHMPFGLGNLTNLQTLSRFVISKVTSSIPRLNGELKELDRLNNLTGTLEIVNLRHGKNAAIEFRATNLKEKQFLQVLALQWIDDEVGGPDDFDEESLEVLQPNPNLKSLSLYRYRGVRFSSWLSSLTYLSKFALFGCKKLQHLPPLDHLQSLKVLELDSLLALEYISDCQEFSNSSIPQSLEELKLKYCPILKGWSQSMRDPIVEVEDDDGNYVGILMPSFRHLSSLCIRGCPQLTSLPLFPCLEKLELYYCSFKVVEQTTMKATAEIASASSSTAATSYFIPFSKLLSLEIGRIEEPFEWWLRNLISLNHLSVQECHGPFLKGIQHLTALRELYFCSLEVIDLSEDGDGFKWEDLKSLNSLWLLQLPNLESLPIGLQHLTSLQILTIDYCPNLMAIPNWIYKLTCLRKLKISQCPKLTSLPLEIRDLTSLQTLEIRCCPILLQRCKRENGIDWDKISHITNLYLEEGNSDA